MLHSVNVGYLDHRCLIFLVLDNIQLQIFQIKFVINYVFTLYAKQRKEVDEYSKKVFVDSHVVLTAPDKIKSEQKTKKGYKFLLKGEMVFLQYIWLVTCLLNIKVF